MFLDGNGIWSDCNFDEFSDELGDGTFLDDIGIWSDCNFDEFADELGDSTF